MSRNNRSREEAERKGNSLDLDDFNAGIPAGHILQLYKSSEEDGKWYKGTHMKMLFTRSHDQQQLSTT